MITQTNLGGGIASVYIADLDTGEELADYHGSRAMVPASNMKILTSGAALFVLGGDFIFRTELIIDDTTTPPTLIVKGDGDPALGDPAIFIGEQPGVTLGTLFDQIADSLKNAGVEEIGRVIIDDTVFDRIYTHPCWPKDQLNRWYCAQVGGLNFHTNVINVYTSPSSSGGTPIVKLVPDAYWIDMQIKAKSDKNKRDTAWVSRPTKANVFTVHGNVSSKSEIPVAINSPAEFGGQLLATELQTRGITIGPADSYVRDMVSLIGPADRYTRSRVVAVITTPLFDVLERTNTDSYNLYAEALLKRIGNEVTSDPGSWENGATVIRMLLAEKLGAGAAESTVISDGSGMCRENKVSAKTLAIWMRRLARSDHWEMFQDSLATPGNGTLRKRFSDAELESQLYAKSGYLTGMYALSGVLVHPQSGQRVVFSILLNDVKAGATSRNAKPLVDGIVEDIDDWMSRRAGSPQFGG
ncbi:MAG: D-alanyl-D-alanine carboxypeptidase/D-alanyl-D-alanine-endopeptidase [Phycisphaerales bacterium]|nr:D-alanyl-D-alanine carboxypeptidase/D-alanyl-D-alanine-endopeptidase [Phycisphaerales bacterium]